MLAVFVWAVRNCFPTCESQNKHDAWERERDYY